MINEPLTKEDVNKAAEEYAWRGDMYDLQTAFKAGAVWYINNAWHKSDEKPIPDKWIVTLTKNNVMRIVYSYDTLSDYFKVMRITDWAYVEDLLPNKEN